MSVVRRRYYFWLFRAYIKRWSKTIISSVIGGVAVFFIFFFFLNFYIFPLLQKKVHKIGYVGSYTINNLPNEVLYDVSYGLTKVNEDGSIAPAAAYKWSIKDGGKVYTFYIKKGQYFNNKEELTAHNLTYNFKDVKTKAIDDYTIEFTLNDPYSPFLVSVSDPIIGKDFSGLGEYEVKKVDVNGGFVRSIRLQSKDSNGYRKIITFYPTQKALKTAYALGEVDMALGLEDVEINGMDISSWSNTSVKKNTDYSRLLTLFYNNSDAYLSDKKIREALNYSLPPEFIGGERAYSSIAPTSIYFSRGPNYGISDSQIALELLEGQDFKDTVFEISTTEEYEKLANKISKEWEKIGIKSKVNIVSGVPDRFQIFLYPVNLPLDPDQYTLWHSSQTNNIIGYKNLRIDKLLEDGRSTTDVEQRKNIYADFQKYLIDDAPASFVYYPYSYSLVRE